MGLKKFFQELKRVSQPQDDEFDKETMNALAEMGLLEDGTADIESTSCNWEAPTARMSKRLAAKVDEKDAAKTAASKAKPRVKGQEQRTRE